MIPSERIEELMVTKNFDVGRAIVEYLNEERLRALQSLDPEWFPGAASEIENLKKKINDNTRLVESMNLPCRHCGRVNSL